MFLFGLVAYLDWGAAVENAAKMQLSSASEGEGKGVFIAGSSSRSIGGEGGATKLRRFSAIFSPKASEHTGFVQWEDEVRDQLSFSLSPPLSLSSVFITCGILD